jgi:hypothetical protein
MLRLLRGPSNSQKKMFCQVERPGSQSKRGMVYWGPTLPA